MSDSMNCERPQDLEDDDTLSEISEYDNERFPPGPQPDASGYYSEDPASYAPEWDPLQYLNEDSRLYDDSFSEEDIGVQMEENELGSLKGGVFYNPSNDWQYHPDWQDGDFALLSSDGWVLMVPSNLLFSSSRKLRELHSPHAPVENRYHDIPAHGLLDQHTGRKDVLVRYLQLIVHNSVGHDAMERVGAGVLINRILFNEYRDLIQLLLLWDCDHRVPFCNTMDRLGEGLILAAQSGRMDKLDVFILGSLTGKSKVPAMAIRAGCFDGFNPLTGRFTNKRKNRAVAELPEHFMTSTDPAYANAAIRALEKFEDEQQHCEGTLPVEYLEGLFCRYLDVPNS